MAATTVVDDVEGVEKVTEGVEGGMSEWAVEAVHRIW